MLKSKQLYRNLTLLEKRSCKIMSEKVRLTEEQKEQNNQTIAQIAVLTEQIKEFSKNLNGQACQLAYANSVSNLETKNEKYVSKAPFQVSDDEKALLAKLREKNADISKVSAYVEKLKPQE